MLATMNSSTRDLPLREHSHLNLQQEGRDTLGDSAGLEDRICPGCKNSVVSEQGGLVVAFGLSFFHVDCFRCAKCGEQVTADTSLLLLSDGSPICANCSYSCNICHLPILDEAIMTGDDSYHAHCFKCKVCKNRIDELVFAKTSHGIYCMNCHNERMIRIRKRTQRHAEKEKAITGGGPAKTRERDVRGFHRENGLNSPTTNGRPNSSRGTEPPVTPRSPSKMPPPQYVEDAFRPTQTANRPTRRPPQGKPLPPVSSLLTDPPASATLALPQEYPTKQNTLPIPYTSVTESSDGRRRSYDDGVRPLNVLFGRKQDSQPSTVPVTQEGLPVTASTHSKRHSINPVTSLSDFNSSHVNILSPKPSPRSASYPGQSSTTPLPPPSSSTSRSHSPTPEQPQTSISESRTNLYPDQSFSSLALSSPRSPSFHPSCPPSPPDSHDQDQTVVFKVPEAPAVTIEAPPPPRSRAKLRQHGNAVQDYGRTENEGSIADDVQGPELKSPRPISPDYRADVPHNIESETDTEAESELDEHDSRGSHSAPPLPPPKEIRAGATQDQGRDEHVIVEDLDLSSMSLADSGDEDMSESSPVERTSRSTFIAPALPPIRLSMNAADFSELFRSVGGLSSLQSLNQVPEVLEEHPRSDTTPPPTATYNSSFTIQDEALVTPKKRDPRESGTRDNVPTNHLDVKLDEEAHSHILSTGISSVTSVSTLSFASESSKPAGEHLRPSNVTITEPDASYMGHLRHDPTDLVTLRLKEVVNDARDRGAQQLKMDRGFVEAILNALGARNEEYQQLKTRFDGIKRTSKQFIEGLTVAQTEFDREQKARRDAEAEVTRLRVLLSSHVAKVTALSGESRKEELRQQLSKELHDNLSGLEHDLSKLKVERDMTLAEVEELSATKRSSATSSEIPQANLGRSLTKHLETIKSQYKRELVPLTQQREALSREIVELKAVRDVFLEETTVLNARNEELAQLSAVYSRKLETVHEGSAPQQPRETLRTSVEKARIQPPVVPLPVVSSPVVSPPLASSTSTFSTLHEEVADLRHIRTPKAEGEHGTPSRGIFKWGASKVAKEISNTLAGNDKRTALEHNFQQLSILRFTRCDHCGDKLWGSQLRCTVCNISIHVRCAGSIYSSCAGAGRADSPPLPPSMFGRDLAEQVRADARGEDRQVPVIVEKCIDAVETLALEYEGIYRKTGGSTQSKYITQLFERGDYVSFDLRDSDRFNDICSVTSVLKNYFRSLPVPLLTYDLHEQFVSAVHIRDATAKHNSLTELVNKLPTEHYSTLRMLMLHLNRVSDHAEKNLMNARNLGVVFGPTLMRSRDPAAEFKDMAGKALSVEWLIENAPVIFNHKA